MSRGTVRWGCWAQAILRRAYQSTDVKTAQRLLVDLARRLETEHPSAAKSVREGLEETLTILTLNLSARLRRSLATPPENSPEPDTTHPAQRQALARRADDAVMGRCAYLRLEAVKGCPLAERVMLACNASSAALRARDRQFGLVLGSRRSDRSRSRQPSRR